MSQFGATLLRDDALARDLRGAPYGPSASDAPQGRGPATERAADVRLAAARPSYALYTRDCQTFLADTGRAARLIFTPNLDHLRLLDRLGALRRAYRSADVILNDSRFVDLLALRGAALCLPGSDLAPSMLERLWAGARVFVIGGEGAVQDQLVLAYPHLALSFIEPSMGYIQRRGERKEIVRQVLAIQPHVVFICTGAPQSELFGAQ